MAKSGKVKKSIAKRIKITKTGKLVHTKCGQGHFNSRAAAKKRVNKRSANTMSPTNLKAVKQGLNK